MKSRRVMALVMPSGSLAILRWDMALALRRPVDIGKEYLQAPFVVDILDSAPAVERGVDMIARGHRYRFAVYRHLSASLEDVIIFVRSEEHTSETQSLMRISYAVFCFKKNQVNK